MYWLPEATSRDAMLQHREAAARLAELGVSWLMVSGTGPSADEAQAFIADYHDLVLRHLDI